MTKDLDALAAELEFAVAEADCKPGEFAGYFISISQLRALLAERKQMKVALEWYGEQTRLCRLIHSEGDSGRHALAEDGGKRARAALTQEGEG